jgi:hypothetical protein
LCDPTAALLCHKIPVCTAQRVAPTARSAFTIDAGKAAIVAIDAIETAK